MPAVRVDNNLLLERIDIPDPTTNRPRPVLGRTTAPQAFEGEGFPVRRAFAGIATEYLDPFIHMDQMGEVHYGPGEPKGTAWHPHRGFETVTYMIDGIFEHQDSIGGGGIIQNGATQWMTAGGGILHIERPPESLVISGGLFHGFQLWVNLPSAKKMIAPAYQDIRADQVTLLTSSDGGVLVRVIAGSIDGHTGPGVTQTPITLAHLTISPGASITMPWDPSYNALAYGISGDGFVDQESVELSTGQLAVLGDGETITLSARASQDERHDAFDVLLLGGQPIGEPVAAYGPFVMNTRDELRQAFEDFQAGRLGTIPAEERSS
jgi:redox-sensitive bicupin YhaK (pirin superfamily)